jgi:hypothetical protein
LRALEKPARLDAPRALLSHNRVVRLRAYKALNRRLRRGSLSERAAIP